MRIFEPKPGVGGYGLSLHRSVLVLSKTERMLTGGWATWYPFRLRWWPSFKHHHSAYEALRNLGWVTRKHYGDQGKPPWISRRRRRLYQQAVDDFREAARAINTLPLGEERYPTYLKMQNAAERQIKYNRFPRR